MNLIQFLKKISMIKKRFNHMINNLITHVPEFVNIACTPSSPVASVPICLTTCQNFILIHVASQPLIFLYRNIPGQRTCLKNIDIRILFESLVKFIRKAYKIPCLFVRPNSMCIHNVSDEILSFPYRCHHLKEFSILSRNVTNSDEIVRPNIFLFKHTLP